jgi:hypothetical protein
MEVVHAGARRNELQPVIGALNAIAVDDFAHVQGCEPVRAAILQGGNLAVGCSIKDDRLFQDGPTKQLTVCEIVRPRRHVPRIS